MGDQFDIGTVNEVVSAAVPDREAIVWGGRRWSYAELAERTRRLASYLHGRGLGAQRERSELANHESGQDHLGIYLYNGNEYLEAMLGAFKARVAPFNVNYRYVADELRYLLNDAGASCLVYHASFAPTLGPLLAELPRVKVLLQVADDSGHDLLPGAVDYEEALASAPAELPPLQPSPDDLYLLYTGGTTGMPKGVAWRQHDIFMSAMGGRALGTWQEVSSYDEIAERANGFGMRMLVLPPLMHGAAQWASSIALSNGSTVVLPSDTRRIDPADVWRTIQDEKVNTVTVVGDAMARPLIDELERGSYDVSSLFAMGSGGAPLNAALKERLLELLPNLIISDSVGSSETGAQMTHASAKGNVATGTFSPGPGAVVVDEDITRLVEPGHEGLGWLAQSGQVPLGYLGDAEKTARTFPTLDGVRYSVPGDRARLLADGTIELLGRDSVTINSGGEKIFAEEVEQAIGSHPGVADVVVCGRPSERWGQEVVAIVKLAAGGSTSSDELAEHAAAHIARYKLPKVWLFKDEIVRSPSGKADYRWAKAQATED